MPKKINIIFQDYVFNRMKEMKGDESFSEFISSLIEEKGREAVSSDDQDKGVGGPEEALTVSSEKLFSILNAINERFTYLTQLSDRIDNLERAVEGLTRVTESVERTAFENRDAVEGMRAPISLIGEKLSDTGERGTLAGGSGTFEMGADNAASNSNEGGMNPDIDDYEFACPNCDGTVEENDYFCKWCAFQLVEGVSTAAFREQYYNEPTQEVAQEDVRQTGYGGAADPMDSEWGKESREAVPPSSRPPSDWNSDRIQLDSSGRPICPKCLESMTYVNDYERWFCEVCWYYAPHDFLRPIGGGEEKDSTVKVRKRPTGRKVNNRKWNSKKISELPLFKKKRDRRK